jgi:hypothetical protein
MSHCRGRRPNNLSANAAAAARAARATAGGSPGIVGLRRFAQVQRQIVGRRLALPEFGQQQPAVAPLLPGLGQQPHQALLHRQAADHIPGRAMDGLEVAQHAGQDVARRGSLQEQAQGTASSPTRPRCWQKGSRRSSNSSRESERPSRVQQHLARGQVQLHQEVPRKRHTQGRQARLGRQLDVKHGQGHRNAAPRLQHPVQVAVLRIVEIVRVAAEPQLVEEVAVEHAQAVQRRGIGRQAAAEALAQPVHLVDHGLHIQPRLGVLTQQSGGLQQREMRVVGHQGGEIFQGAGGLEAHWKAHGLGV